MTYIRHLNGPIAWLLSLRFTPDDYRRDPELWLANQAGHIALGVWLALFSCAAWHWGAGEFPRRDGIWAFIAILYLWYELGRQKWRGLDTVEDWLFVAAYGAGGALFCFHEVSLGSDRIYASLSDILLVSFPPTTHLILGAAIRAGRRLRAERQSKDV